MDKPKDSISRRLREAMDEKGKRQADLVRETGLDRGSISSYLSGKYEPKQKAIYKLARALDVSEAWLLGYDVPMSRTDDQKKNDQLAQLVAYMRKDPAFFDVVEKLSRVAPEQRESIDRLLSGILGE